MEPFIRYCEREKIYQYSPLSKQFDSLARSITRFLHKLKGKDQNKMKADGT